MWSSGESGKNLMRVKTKIAVTPTSLGVEIFKSTIKMISDV